MLLNQKQTRQKVQEFGVPPGVKEKAEDECAAELSQVHCGFSLRPPRVVKAFQYHILFSLFESDT